MISGAVFTDRFVSQPFVEYMFIGGTPYLNDRIYDVAKILRVLKSCLLDLRRFYTELTPPNPPSPSTGTPITPSVFPHFRNFKVKGNHVAAPFTRSHHYPVGRGRRHTLLRCLAQRACGAALKLRLVPQVPLVRNP